MVKEVKNIITVGASAGGITAVSRLVASFAEDLDAAVFIVIHLGRESLASVIVNQIQRSTTLKCKIPLDGEQIENNVIYLAPADRHMMLEHGSIIVKKGAFENHWRPSIDVLFRSAAAAYASCVTGVILTGLLDDGTSGMLAIKKSGGRCIIQETGEAEFPDMPYSVLQNVSVDYELPVHEIGHVLSDLYSRSDCSPTEVPVDVKLEAAITLRMSSSIDDQQQLGAITPLTCPDCGGVLAKLANEGSLVRYRCYTGHTFTESVLEAEQVKSIEESLWVAIRMLEERRNLLSNMLNADKPDRIERAGHLKVHIGRLKDMLQKIGELDNESQSKK
jgi:two-component system chemotaxis response regulator CheB